MRGIGGTPRAVFSTGFSKMHFFRLVPKKLLQVRHNRLSIAAL